MREYEKYHLPTVVHDLEQTSIVGPSDAKTVAGIIRSLREHVEELSKDPKPAYCCCKCGMPDPHTMRQPAAGIPPGVVEAAAIAGNDDCSAILAHG